MDRIKLHCKGCGKRVSYPRSADTSLPASVVRIESATCDICDNGGFGMEFWFDADGNEVSQDIHA